MHALRFERLGRGLAISRPNLRDGVDCFVLVGISLLREGGNLVQFFLAQRKQPALKLRFNHSLASTVVRNNFQYSERAATGRPEESAVSVPGQLVFARLGNATGRLLQGLHRFRSARKTN